MRTVHTACFRPIRVGPALIAAMLPLVLVACHVAPVQAQVDPQFQLYINRDITHLPSYDGAPDNTPLFGGYIDIQNNRPYVELKNIGTIGITSFEMTIGSDFFHFAELPQGFANIAKKPANLAVTATAPDNGDKLLLNFGGTGLAPGDFVHFQIRFAGDDCPTCGLPSFQAALFNICHDGESMGDPSQVWINGKPFGGWPADSWSPYVEGHYAPPGSNLNPPTLYPFFPNPPLVPEPSSVLLALMAIGGMASYRTPRNRRG